MNKNNYSYDVCVVGAGPAGATTAYYLAKQGRKVLLLDKKKFPRDKIGGDAFPRRAQKHLEEMGVLDRVVKEKKGRWAAIGGLVSPSGISYIGDSSKGSDAHLVIAIKRKIVDEMVMQAAKQAGAELVEEFIVKKVALDKEQQIWIIANDKEEKATYTAKVLVIADGAASRLARALGIVNTPPQATCSRAYIESGTYQFQHDGVCFYPRRLVPGYCSLFRQADDDLGFCCYILPFGEATTSDLYELHHTFIESDPFISEAIGPNAKLEKMKAAPIRFGGVKQSYGQQLLLVGDAAGMIDPLTGEGLQYAMDGAEIAAETINEAFKKKKFTKRFFKRYQKRWMRSFGRDFKWSKRMAKFCAKYPIFLDAFASLSNKKGDSYMIKWGKIMTGSQRKINFFLPHLALPLFFEALKLRRKLKRR
jgi:geranylgeranyl reductase family protein